MKILLPTDGSPASLRAVDYVIGLGAGGCPPEVLLVNVQSPTDSWELRSHLRPAEIEAMQEATGGEALAAARARLDAAKTTYAPAVLLGPVAESIVRHAAGQGCDMIVMGNKGESFLEEAVTGSVAHEVLRLTSLPVTFIK